jgi:hypothetical protein
MMSGLHYPALGFFDYIETGLSQEEAVAKAEKAMEENGYTDITIKKRRSGVVEVTGTEPEDRCQK